MMPDKSVIQTTREKHAEQRDMAIEISRKHLMLMAEVMPTTAEQDAYLAGLADGWATATFAILRDGNCKFEVE